MPPGVGNAYLFQVFNTMSYTVVLSTPMILYFKKLGASATVLGIVLALPALLNILQIPAARFVEAIGYRAFVLRGWTVRVALVLAMAGVPFLPEKINALTRIALLLFLMFAYNASRGISLCGFFPWVTQWIPEEVRGRYVSRDQLSTSLATLGTMILAAFYLRPPEGKYSYGLLFFASSITAMISLWFLRRIPDVPVPLSSESPIKVPYKEMLLHPPFFKLLVYNAVFLVASSGGGVFWIPMLRDSFAVTDSVILGMMVLWSAVCALCLWGFGHLIDRVGSRPLLGLATLLFAVHLSCWCTVAARLVPFNLMTILVLQTSSGISVSVFNLANTRLVMATVPAMGRSHFFALYSVVTSLVSGVFPILWGMLLDALTGWGVSWSKWEWNQYSVSYSATIVVALISLVLRNQLSEVRAMTTDAFLKELFVHTPSRAISRLLARRPPA
jgi:MFS family permease